jgi:D-amino-acid dehydrogenase
VVRVLVTGGKCLGVELASGDRIESDRVVLAAGAWTDQLVAATGVRIPLQAAKGYHLDLVSLDPPLRTACVLTESYVAVTPLADSMRLAGTLEFSGLNHRLVPRRMDMLLRGATSSLPSVAGATILSRWCGLRPCIADGLPVVGWAPGITGLFIATGHAKMGLTLGPITGRLVSESILDGQTSVPIDSLSAHRF